MFAKEKPIRERLSQLIDLFADLLPAANISDAEELIEHGEYGEALELICTQIYEYEVEVSANAYEIIEDCGRRMGLAETSWEFLGELRRSDVSGGR